MPESWMDWARLIGSAIGGTVIAILAGWQFYARLIRPLIKRFEPIVTEITGPGNEPGIRQLVADVGDTAKSGLRAALQAAEGVNGLRRDVQGIASDHGELRRDVNDLKLSSQRQGERLGNVEQAQKATDAKLEQEIQERRASGKPTTAPGEVTEGSQGPSGAGAAKTGELAPTPPRR